MKILMVDDDTSLSLIYKDQFKKAGFECNFASDGAEALEHMRKYKPDAVLLDLQMPVMDGFKVLEEIQTDETLNKIPIIVHSNTISTAAMGKALDLGARDYLVKSDVSIGELIEKLKQYA